MRPRSIPLAAGGAAVALLLTSCAASSGGAVTPSEPAATGSSSAAPSAAATGDDCKLSDPVKVGAALSLTGAAGSYGASQQKGLQTALDTVTARGGITYDLKVEDDQTDPKQGISIFEQFLNRDKVSVILGPTLSNAAKTTDPIAQEAKVPVLGVSNTATGITEIGDYVFRDSLPETAVIPQTIKKAKESLGLKKVVVMYSNDDAFTESGYQAFQAALKDNGVEIVKTLTFSKADTDFRALLTEAKDAAPDALVVSGLIEAAIPLVTQARQVGITAPIIGGNGFNSPKLMADAGKAAEGVIVGAAWNSASESPENATFLKAFKAKNGGDPDQFAAQAYTGLILVDDAVRAKCSAKPADVRDGLAGLSDIKTPLGSFSFDKQREPQHPAVVQVVKDGAFTVLQ